MNRRYPVVFSAAVSAAAIVSALLVLQTSVPAAEPQNGAAAPAPRSGATMRPASDVLAQIGQMAGLTVVADSSVTAAVPGSLSASTTPENIEQKIAEVIRVLPKGATWAELYLPITSDRPLNGDAVADYAYAQTKLFGKIGNAPAGTVEIMGQRLPTDQATGIIAALNLKPVYLVTNPNERALAASGNADLARWSQMTPEQQQEYARQQAQQILNMDPSLRQQMFQQQGAQQRMIHGAMFELSANLPPDQRNQLLRDLTSELTGAFGTRGPRSGPGNSSGTP